MFASSYKRNDVSKRGRFNSGNKEVICLCDYARITSTTGGVEFDIINGERKTLRRKREKGSEVFVVVKMTQEEYYECFDYCKHIIQPEHCKITVAFFKPNSEEGEILWDSSPAIPHKTFSARLLTELKEEGRMRNVTRETQVYLHKSSKDVQTYIYELGIPICEIDCAYHIDVQQKVPLSSDRDKVDGKYLKDIYALVLNNTVSEVSKENISQTWIRSALDSDKVEPQAIMEVKTKRFGAKAVISNPFDPNADDEAISKGYKVIRGSEMSGNEWAAMKAHGGLVSSSSMFGKTGISVEHLQYEKHHYPLTRLASRIAKDFMDVSLRFVFYREAKINAAASYGDSQLSFNLAHLSKDFFLPDEDGYVKQNTLDLLIHELGHQKGNHTEHSYHECITAMGAWCTRQAIADKKYFKLK